MCFLDKPFNLATSSKTKAIFLGSLTVPLKGCGAKYGQSVSTNKRSKGTSSHTSLVFWR